MDIKLITKRDYEKKSNWTLGENKPKQSQFSEDRRQKTDVREQRSTKNILTGIRRAIIS
jgi:hypothetical protein